MASAVDAWRAAVELLEEAAEVEFVREAQAVGDLFHGEIAAGYELDGGLVEPPVQVGFRCALRSGREAFLSSLT